MGTTRFQRQVRTGLAILGTVAVVTAAAATPASSSRPAPTAHDGTDPPRCSTAVEERNLDTFEAYLALLMSGDIEGAQASFADGAVVEVHGTVPYAGTYPAAGTEYPAVMQQYWAAPTGDGSQESPELWADCDQVILRGAYARTAVATGEPLDTEVVEFFTFARGEIVRDDFYFTDTAAVNEALEPD